MFSLFEKSVEFYEKRDLLIDVSSFLCKYTIEKNIEFYEKGGLLWLKEINIYQN